MPIFIVVSGLGLCMQGGVVNFFRRYEEASVEEEAVDPEAAIETTIKGDGELPVEE